MSMGRFGDPSLYTRTEPLALGLPRLLATSVYYVVGVLYARGV